MAGLRLWLVVAALLAGALVVACNGDDENGDEDGAVEQPTATAAVEDENGDVD